MSSRPTTGPGTRTRDFCQLPRPIECRRRTRAGFQTSAPLVCGAYGAQPAGASRAAGGGRFRSPSSPAPRRVLAGATGRLRLNHGARRTFAEDPRGAAPRKRRSARRCGGGARRDVRAKGEVCATARSADLRLELARGRGGARNLHRGEHALRWCECLGARAAGWMSPAEFSGLSRGRARAAG